MVEALYVDSAVTIGGNLTTPDSYFGVFVNDCSRNEVGVVVGYKHIGARVRNPFVFWTWVKTLFVGEERGCLDEVVVVNSISGVALNNAVSADDKQNDQRY